MGRRGWTRCVREHKNKLTLRKRHLFVIEKYIEDAKQDEKDVPDLLESIMRLTDPVLKRRVTAKNTENASI